MPIYEMKVDSVTVQPGSGYDHNGQETKVSLVVTTPTKTSGGMTINTMSDEARAFYLRNVGKTVKVILEEKDERRPY